MRTAVKLLACSVGLFTLASAQAAAPTNVVSDPVGFYKVPINPGANFISAPLQKVHTYRGVLNSLGSSSNVVFNGVPGFAVDEFAPVTLSSFKRHQYILIVRNTTGANTGDWWKIESNTANSVTVDTMGENLISTIAAGTQFEIRKLTSFADLFGSGADSILTPSIDLGPQIANEDVVRFLNGVAYAPQQVILFAGNYRVGAGNWTNGTQLTIDPDEPLMFFRQAAAPATNLVSLGQVQTKPLTHYINEGGYTFSSPFPVNAPWSTSGLAAAGVVGDATLAPSFGTQDIMRVVNGTAYGAAQILYYTGTPTVNIPTPPSFVVGASLADNTVANQMAAGKGYVYFRAAGAGTLVWRQAVPFTP